ncbi:hypothetical protein R3P38DRAFT_2764894 [Favolaschia claudopus]|uniref:Uncharacterized protein n=1 Tax=Favolaschia claudopus TaxID=2862362 RepID=A0AAW0DEG3_9AGAR
MTDPERFLNFDRFIVHGLSGRNEELLILLSDGSPERKNAMFRTMNAQHLCFVALIAKNSLASFIYHAEIAVRRLQGRVKEFSTFVKDESHKRAEENIITCHPPFLAKFLSAPHLTGHGIHAHPQSLVGTRSVPFIFDPDTLERHARRLLMNFRLEFDDLRLMLTATGSIIVGSMVLSLTRPDLDLMPVNLDVITGTRKGTTVADFFILAGSFEQVQQAEDRLKMKGVGDVITLTLVGLFTVNIMESTTDNPLDVVARFHFSCAHMAWQADGLWIAYPDSVHRGWAITTPHAYPLPDGFPDRFMVWSSLRKYITRGFNVYLNDCPHSHVCGEDFNCPATLRASDDRGCRFYPFPEWKFSSDCCLMRPTCWTMAGTGCTQGILVKGGESSERVLSMTDLKWLRTLEKYMESAHGPMPLNEFPDYLVPLLY